MKKKQIVSVISILLLILIGIIVGSSIRMNQISYLRELENKEPKTEATQTNTNAALYSLDKQKAILANFMPVYQAGVEAYKNEIDAGMYIIPGLNATKTLESGNDNAVMCTTMDPQGITLTEEYILISACCHEKVHNSVLYVLDRNTHKFIKEVVLDGKPHAGGVAYDQANENIWVCSRENGIAEVVAIKLADLKAYKLDVSYQPIRYDQRIQLPKIKRTSFLTYHENNLYVGYFTEKHEGVIEKYQLSSSGRFESNLQRRIKFDHHKAEAVTAKPDQTEKITNEIQGVTFYQDKILLSRSHGPYSSSKVLVFNDEKDHYYLDTDVQQEIQLPERIEQISTSDSALYVIFESACYSYRFLESDRVDRALKLDLAKLINQDSAVKKGANR